jgi:uncharacterized protein YndB with AHSA1/START domain
MSTERRHCDAPASAVWEVLSDPWLFASWVVGAGGGGGGEGQWQ